MINLDIVDTDSFLDMPVSSQLLYFHLNARGDDDGFVASPKKITRMVGAQPDDMKVLVSKKFIITFSDGVCVIKHWRINNFIRKDIYEETKYSELKKSLFIRPNGAYTQTQDDRALPVPLGHYKIENIDVNATSTLRRPSIVKKRIGKVSVDKAPDEFELFWSEYPKKIAKQTALRSWLKIDPSKELIKTIMASLNKYKQTEQWRKDKGQFIPYPATWLNQGRYNDEIDTTAGKRTVDKV